MRYYQNVLEILYCQKRSQTVDRIFDFRYYKYQVREKDFS